jgi:hypothetical protein
LVIVMGGVTVRCYGKTRYFHDREDAEKQYLEAMVMSEGSERNRYTEVYLQLKEGLDLCTDGSE